MLIRRFIQDEIIDRLLHYNKAVVIYGARQVGKTTLCNGIIDELRLKTLRINADESKYIDVLSSRDAKKLSGLVGGYELLFIDEAQRIPEIGMNLKILIDQHKGLKILVTGSSSFELSQQVGEPLTGRKWTYKLFPIAQLELKNIYNTFEFQDQLEDRLIWGAYPEIWQLQGYDIRRAYMQELTDNYLYKDLFALQNIRHPEKLHKLLRLLAFQIGSEVSLSELGTQLEMTKETVARYLDFFEKTFIIVRLSAFSRNLRKEISKNHKYYFLDLGIRNSIIDNFQSLSQRNDVGQLWENFLLIERLKRNTYQEQWIRPYFWRTYTGSEIDYVEEKDNNLCGYEMKWKAKGQHAPRAWKEQYQANWKLIHKENWLDFVL